MIRSYILKIFVFFVFILFGCVKNAQLPNDNTVKKVMPAVSTVKETIDEEEPTSQSVNNRSEKSRQSFLDESLDFCQVSQDFWQKGEFENALEALDKAYSLILKVNSENNPKIEQQKEDLRFTISRRIMEIYASRNIVVNGNHKAIPIIFNDYVEKELKLFAKGGAEHNFFIKSYKLSGKYRESILKRLKEAGLPLELSWLPLIESGFKVNAFSKARALGLWQFVPSTGYKFGLKRDTYIDERLDPIKSTEAAIEYLKELHQIFGDWATVLAAYNCGEGRVLRIIRTQNINYLDNFWDLYEQLPRETARYVPRFMATLHIINNPAKYGLDQIEIEKPLQFESIRIARRSRLVDIAKAIDVPEKVLKELNPSLRYKLLPEDEYTLKVPPGKVSLVTQKIEQIPVSAKPMPAYVYHRIRRGETLSGIALRYNTSISRIMRANNLRKSSYIVAGKKLKIPKRGIIVPPKTVASEESAEKTFEIHIVKAGDSLWNLAGKYGTTTGKIQRANNLITTRLNIGQTLKIPIISNESLQQKGLRTYKVKNGDTPYSISREYNMSLERFLSLNRLTPRTKIYPGQRLYIE